MTSSESLRVLSILHTVKGILLIIAGAVGIPMVWVGLSMSSQLASALNGQSTGSATSTDSSLALVGFGIVAGHWVWGICNFLAASYISQRKKRTFIQVVSAINCLSVPLGTLLGVFTIIVVSNREVVREFSEREKRRRLRGY